MRCFLLLIVFFVGCDTALGLDDDGGLLDAPPVDRPTDASSPELDGAPDGGLFNDAELDLGAEFDAQGVEFDAQGAEADSGFDSGFDLGGDLGVEADAGPVEPPPPGCHDAPEDPDYDRVVLVGQPFGQPGVNGTEIRSLTLTQAGVLEDDGARLDVGAQPQRIEFTPSGRYALVLVDGGGLVSVSVDGAGQLLVVDEIGLPAGGGADLRLSPDGAVVWVASSHNTVDGGIFGIDLACDGTLSVRGPHYGLRVVQALSISPKGDRALLLGGQAVFAPIDEDDVRLLALGEDGAWVEQAAFDIYTDFVTAEGIAWSPDGARALVPNSSPFSDEGGQIAVLHVGADTVLETQRIEGLPDANFARFAPDGQTVLVSQVEPGRINLLIEGEDGFEVTDQVRAGLANQLAIVETGALAGTVLAASVSPADGSQIVHFEITAPGIFMQQPTLSLGRGSQNIPRSIAVPR